MSSVFKRARRKLTRAITSPFAKLGQKIKSAGQRFVIKTIERNGGSVGTPQVSGGGASSELLIALLRSKSAISKAPFAPFTAIPVSNYLLTSHPAVEYYFHRPVHSRLECTPPILAGKFESNVSAWLHANVQPTDRVLLTGAENAYHALTIARIVQQGGKLKMLLPDGEVLSDVRLNLETNNLAHAVELVPIEEMSSVPDLQPTMIIHCSNAAESHGSNERNYDAPIFRISGGQVRSEDLPIERLDDRKVA